MDAGDTVAYTFGVTNTGTTTISNGRHRGRQGRRHDLPSTTLAAGASTTCTTTTPYVITQATWTPVR